MVLEISAAMRQLARDIASGNSLLFLGSGFSRGATNNALQQQLPTGAALKEILCAEFKQDPAKTSLQRAAAFYSDPKMKGVKALLDLLREHFLVNQEGVTSTQVSFLAHPWYRI